MKRVSVFDVIMECNSLNRNLLESIEARQARNEMVRYIIVQAGLEPDERPLKPNELRHGATGEKAGVNVDGRGSIYKDNKRKYENVDHTRIQFILPPVSL